MNQTWSTSGHRIRILFILIRGLAIVRLRWWGISLKLTPTITYRRMRLLERHRPLSRWPHFFFLLLVTSARYVVFSRWLSCILKTIIWTVLIPHSHATTTTMRHPSLAQWLITNVTVFFALSSSRHSRLTHVSEGRDFGPLCFLVNVLCNDLQSYIDLVFATAVNYCSGCSHNTTCWIAHCW